MRFCHSVMYFFCFISKLIHYLTNLLLYLKRIYLFTYLHIYILTTSAFPDILKDVNVSLVYKKDSRN